MKIKIIILLLFCLSLHANAQEKNSSTEKTLKNSLGVDIANFLQFIKYRPHLNNFYSPYIITYKRYFKNNVIRAGFGINYYNIHDENPFSYYGSGKNKVRDTSSIDYEICIGYEREVPLSKKWFFYFGIDIGYSFGDYTLFDNYTYEYDGNFYEFHINSNRHYSLFGLSSFCGIGFNITPSILLATEQRLSFFYGHFQFDKYHDYYTNNVKTTLSTESSSNGNDRFSYYFPTCLNLIFKF